MPSTFDNVDDYIASFPEDVQPRLQQMRLTIGKALPDNATESISYAIPTFKVGGRNIVHFAGWSHHIAMYPVPEADDAHVDARIAEHRTGRGTLNFPNEQPLPLDFIGQIAKLLADQRGQAAP